MCLAEKRGCVCMCDGLVWLGVGGEAKGTVGFGKQGVGYVCLG